MAIRIFVCNFINANTQTRHQVPGMLLSNFICCSCIIGLEGVIRSGSLWAPNPMGCLREVSQL